MVSWTMITLLTLLTLVSSVYGVDRVVYRNELGNEETVEGDIQSLSGTGGLRLVRVSPMGETGVPGGTELAIPFSRVVRLDTERTDSQKAGDAAFVAAEQTGQSEHYSEAIPYYLQSRQTDELRPWVRLWLTWRLVLCYNRTGRRDEAAREYFLICRVDSGMLFWENVPLVWTRRPMTAPGSDTLATLAKSWLSKEENPARRDCPPARLLAASILLDDRDPVTQRQAADALKELVVLPIPERATEEERTARRGIAQLALAQMIRTRLTKGIKEEELARLEKLTGLLPKEATAGVRFLMGQGRLQLNEKEKAISELRRVAVAPWSSLELRTEAERLIQAAGE